MTDGSPAEPNPSPLPCCHDAVPTLNRFGHQPIEASKAQLCPTIGLKCAFVRHARTLAAGPLRAASGT